MKRKRREVEWKLHDELANALNGLDYVEVWAGATTPTQVRVQLRIANWDKWLNFVKLIRVAEAEREANQWHLHICEEFVLRPGTKDLVVTWHFTVKADDNVSAIKQICNAVVVAIQEPVQKGKIVKKRPIREGEVGPDGVMSYPFACMEGNDRNIPVGGRGVVKTDPGKVR